ncbi:hypothetical protein DAHU10_000220 [Hanseniaspora uvarum]|nr:hypothetical protein DAHU10_000220 [Hanseniaspora uvarum]
MKFLSASIADLKDKPGTSWKEARFTKVIFLCKLNYEEFFIKFFYCTSYSVSFMILVTRN